MGGGGALTKDACSSAIATAHVVNWKDLGSKHIRYLTFDNKKTELQQHVQTQNVA